MEGGMSDLSPGLLGSMLDLSADLRYTDWMDNDFLKTGDSSLSNEQSSVSEAPPLEDCGVSLDMIESPQLFLPVDESGFDPRLGAQLPLTTDPLSAVSQNIVERLRESILYKPRNSYIKLQWDSEVERQCLEFFNPDNLRHFVDLYWVTWYIHWPVIHKATFQISETPCTLVAAMVLIGASYSTNPKDRAYARTFCDAVEEIVFSDEYFGDSTVYSVLNAACLEARLRSLQAAHAMCLYQAWEGYDIAKQRARRHRFGLVVAMARELGFAHASHGDLTSPTESNFNWKEFILKEELIRTLNYMVVLDCGFILLYNMPPRVFVSELQADLACPEACFQATSASECFRYLTAWLSHPLAGAGRMSILDAVEQLSHKDMGWDNVQTFTHLGYLNLGFLAMAIHSVIFQIRSSNCWQSQSTSALENWLRNWRMIWTLRELGKSAEAFGTPLPPHEIPPNLEDRWRNAGFMKDATQFWLLAKILLDKVEGGKEARAPVNPFARKPDEFDQTSMKHLKELLKNYGKRQEQG